MEAVKSINLGVAFLLELCLLVALSYIGFYIGGSTIMGWILGIGIPLLVAVLWGKVLAPQAKSRLEMPWLLILKLVLFTFAALGLLLTNEQMLAIWFGFISIVHFICATVWKQL